MSDRIKLEVMSDGSVSLNGTRITLGKMWGIQKIVFSKCASKKWIVDALGVEKEIRNKAIDEFAEKLKERLKGMQMAEMQGEDVCPYGDTLEECPYINHELGCQYCAREQTIKDVDEIAEQMKKGE